jgi:hypothetical protein
MRLASSTLELSGQRAREFVYNIKQISEIPNLLIIVVCRKQNMQKSLRFDNIANYLDSNFQKTMDSSKDVGMSTTPSASTSPSSSNNTSVSQTPSTTSSSPSRVDFEDYESLPTTSAPVHMTAGAIAGIMEHCVMYPLDSVKVGRTLKFSCVIITVRLELVW